MTPNTKIYRVLFVCLGNICRSPAAEAIFKAYAEKAGLRVDVDSAGTSGWHEGEMADQRMRSTASERGYNITSISRPFDRNKDFDRFDLIVPMDGQNYADLRDLAQTREEVDKIQNISQFIQSTGDTYIPDPYYGGKTGFHRVIDLLEEASAQLVSYVETKLKLDGGKT